MVLMGVRQAGGDGAHDLEGTAHRGPLPTQERREALARQALHHQEGDAGLPGRALPLGHIVDAHDVLVVELGDGARLLAQQHAHRLLDESLTREQELEGHHAL
jgi:hypothetical protein